VLTGPQPALVVVVGAGGTGKTTLSAALALRSVAHGHDTLVMTFDPSLRLKDALRVDEAAKGSEIEVPCPGSGRLSASLLDAKLTFDRLVVRHAPDAASRERILANRHYQHLASGLAGVLEYMAVERLYEAASAGRHGRVILDTPPTRQAIDFLEAPDRIIGFLDSGALRIALNPWFDERGHLRGTSRLRGIGRSFEKWLDRVVGLELLRDMAEFFQAFAPLYSGFRERAEAVKELLRSERTVFVLVGGPGREKNPDTLFFARRLQEGGFRLGPIVVNGTHPRLESPEGEPGEELMEWLAARDRSGVEALAALLPAAHGPISLPLMEHEPTDLEGLDELGRRFEERLATARG